MSSPHCGVRTGAMSFSPFPNQGPFLEHIGPILLQDGTDESSAELVLALQTEDRHANHRGTVQGGVLSTFADFALGRAIEADAEDGKDRATVSLTVDYLKPAMPGDFIESRTRVDRVGVDAVVRGLLAGASATARSSARGRSGSSRADRLHRNFGRRCVVSGRDAPFCCRRRRRPELRAARRPRGRERRLAGAQARQDPLRAGQGRVVQDRRGGPDRQAGPAERDAAEARDARDVPLVDGRDRDEAAPRQRRLGRARAAGRPAGDRPGLRARQRRRASPTSSRSRCWPTPKPVVSAGDHRPGHAARRVQGQRHVDLAAGEVRGRQRRQDRRAGRGGRDRRPCS